MLDKNERKIKINSVRENSNRKQLHAKIVWEGESKEFPVFNIPLEALIYNKYNGRIITKTKSIEKVKNKAIDPATEEGNNIIDRLLFESKEKNNKHTMADLKKHGQMKHGVITQDGIIVDGNRRAMLLKRLGKTHFETIILPVDLLEEPKEIERLEVSIQLGEDEKVPYGPIEKYVKVKEMMKTGSSIEEIADMWNKRESQIKEWSDTMETMDHFLETYEMDGVYCAIPYQQEDAFLTLTKAVKGYTGGKSSKPFSGYKDVDVDDLKRVTFDYIRAKWGVHVLRNLHRGEKDSQFFGNEKIWKDFLSRHNEAVEEYLKNEPPLNQSADDIEEEVRCRDKLYEEHVIDPLTKNLEYASRLLSEEKMKKSPIEGAKTVRRLINDINESPMEDSRREAKHILEGFVNDLVIKRADKEEVTLVLSQVLNLMKVVSSKNLKKEKVEEQEKILDMVREINSLSFNMKKELGE